MKKSTKAILASAFIFPGVGQYLLKRKKSALAFVAISFACTLVILYYVYTIAQSVVDQILNSDAQINLFEMRAMIREQMANSNEQILDFAIAVLVITWIASIIDALLTVKRVSGDVSCKLDDK